MCKPFFLSKFKLELFSENAKIFLDQWLTPLSDTFSTPALENTGQKNSRCVPVNLIFNYFLVFGYLGEKLALVVQLLHQNALDWIFASNRIEFDTFLDRISFYFAFKNTTNIAYSHAGFSVIVQFWTSYIYCQQLLNVISLGDFTRQVVCTNYSIYLGYCE